MTTDEDAAPDYDAPDYVQMFGVLMREPYLLRPWEIKRLTPRQVFDIYFAKRDRETGEVVQQARQTGGGEKEMPNALAGLNLDKYECWKPYPGEDDNDPFSVPREVVKERSFAMFYEVAKLGGMRQYGVHPEPLKRPNPDLTYLRDYFDRAWAENCENFEKLKAERLKAQQETTDGSGPDAG